VRHRDVTIIHQKGLHQVLKQIAVSATVLALVLGLSGCGGNDTQTVVKTTETQGKQLLDLKAAYDQGVISESEYNRTKNEILKQN
jgi:uncharacterized membrane protein